VHDQALFFSTGTMSYLVLARKWRPLTFDQMVGQEFISRTLRNAIESGRVAHAFLFTGPRGVGKTSAARILAKSLNCEQGPTPDPCNRCVYCLEIMESRSLDVYEIDGASNTSVDDVRELRENVRYLPRPGKKRIYIIDEVHMLSKSAFNALLKTLEEPPDHVVFIFATTEPQKVPETIQSRCQRYDFRRIPASRIGERLREIAAVEGIEAGEASLAWIAKAADGSMRDALSLLDQMISYCGRRIPDEAVQEMLGLAGREVFFRISDAVLSQNPAGCIEALEEIYRAGCDLGPFYQDLVEHFRNLLVASLLEDPAPLLQMGDGEASDLKKQASKSTPEDLRRLLSLLIRAEKDVLKSSMPRVGLEATLVKMAHLSNLEPLPALLERVLKLEERPAPLVKSGPPLPPPAGTAGPGSRQRPASSGSKGSEAPGKTSSSAPVRPPKARPPAAEPSGTPAPKAKTEPPLAGPAATQTKGKDEAIRAILEAVSRERAGLAAQLEAVEQWDVTPARVTALCPRGSFLFEKLRHPEVRAWLEAVVKRCVGPSVAFDVRTLHPSQPEPVLAEDGQPGLPGIPRTPGGQSSSGPGSFPTEEEALNSPGVRNVQELFRGKVREIRSLSAAKEE